MIFLILGENAEKVFVQLWDRCVRTKRVLKKKSGLGASCASVDKLKQKLGNLKVLAWLDNYAKPRPARSNVGDISDEDNMKK